MRKQPGLNKVWGISLAMAGMLLVGCRSGKELTTKKKPPKEDCVELHEKAQLANYHPEWVSLKATVHLNSDGNTNSFKTTIRNKKDSAIWVSFTPRGVPLEGMRLLLTKDSVKVMDRLHKKFFAGDYNYIRETFKVDLDFAMIQDLMFGNYLGVEGDKINCDAIVGGYFLSALKKRAFHKHTEKGTHDSKAVSFLILPETYRLGNMMYIDPLNNQSLEVKYSEFEDHNGLIPATIEATIVADSKSEIKIVYTKITEGKEISMPFRIPDKYERISQ